MRWYSESWEKYYERMFKWHRIFAFSPKWCCKTEHYVWLQFIERRAIFYFSRRGAFEWEYREVGE